METGLKLLMSDGPVLVTVTPHLNSGQYDELLAIVQRISKTATADELRRELQTAATQWGSSVEVTRLNSRLGSLPQWIRKLGH